MSIKKKRSGKSEFQLLSSTREQSLHTLNEWERWRRNIFTVIRSSRRGWWFEWECACSRVIAHFEWCSCLSHGMYLHMHGKGEGKLVLAPVHFGPFINNEKMFFPYWKLQPICTFIFISFRFLLPLSLFLHFISFGCHWHLHSAKKEERCLPNTGCYFFCSLYSINRVVQS